MILFTFANYKLRQGQDTKIHVSHNCPLKTFLMTAYDETSIVLKDKQIMTLTFLFYFLIKSSFPKKNLKYRYENRIE